MRTTLSAIPRSWSSVSAVIARAPRQPQRDVDLDQPDLNLSIRHVESRHRRSLRGPPISQASRLQLRPSATCAGYGRLSLDFPRSERPFVSAPLNPSTSTQLGSPRRSGHLRGDRDDRLPAGLTLLGWVFVAAVAGLQTLLATTGYCLGCKLYFLRLKLGQTDGTLKEWVGHARGAPRHPDGC